MIILLFPMLHRNRLSTSPWCLLFFFTLKCSICGAQTDKTISPSASDLGIIPDSVYYFNLVLEPNKYTWRDFDHYYQVMIPKYHYNQSYTENLKKAVISGMVSTGKITEITDKKVNERYTEEWLSLSMADPEITVNLLESLKGHWADRKIKSTAEMAYNNLIRQVKDTAKYPDQVLASNEAKFKRLQDFAAGIKE
ncbi:MAG: hypothetical protein JNJ57_07955 [Saprospiraceae bacterium]|nr:hypothetical protein [Saprospiraceae bacterium]